MDWKIEYFKKLFTSIYICDRSKIKNICNRKKWFELIKYFDFFWKNHSLFRQFIFSMNNNGFFTLSVFQMIPTCNNCNCQKVDYLVDLIIWTYYISLCLMPTSFLFIFASLFKEIWFIQKIYVSTWWIFWLQTYISFQSKILILKILFPIFILVLLLIYDICKLWISLHYSQNWIINSIDFRSLINHI
jgi:hypothetical protein